MKFAYQTQTKQYNDQSHLVCVEHGFVVIVNKTHTSIKKTVQCIKIRSESVMLHISTIHSSCTILLSTCFIKSVGNTHQTHTDYDWSVYWLAFCLICKFH